MWAELGYGAVVLDPGAAMVAVAGSVPGVRAVRGIAQRMPFGDGVFAVTYFHLSIHYGDWRPALDEARRVLGRGGKIVIWTLGPDHHGASMLARWFPSVEAIDRRRFPDPEDVADYLRCMGEVSSARVVETRTRAAGAWAAAVRAGFVSTLQLVPAVELAAGLAAFRKMHPDPDELIDYQMYWTRLVALV